MVNDNRKQTDRKENPTPNETPVTSIAHVVNRVT